MDNGNKPRANSPITEVLTEVRDKIDCLINTHAGSLECRQCSCLERQLAACVEDKSRHEQRISELEEQLNEVTRRHGDAHHQLNRVDFITERTQQQIDETILDISRQKDKESALLRSRVAELESEVVALRVQVDVYRSDFETERADREKAVGRAAGAEAQLAAERHRAAELEAKLQEAWVQLKNAVAFNAQQTRVMRSMEHRTQRSSNFSQLIPRGSNDVTDAACPTAAADIKSSSSRALKAESLALVHQLDCLSSSLQRPSSRSRSPSPPPASADSQLRLVSLDGLDETDGIVSDSVLGASGAGAAPVKWWLKDSPNRDQSDSNLIDLDLISDTESPQSSTSSQRSKRTSSDRNRLQGCGSSRTTPTRM